MSDSNKANVEFGGAVDPSYDSSVEHVKKGLAETAKKYGGFAAEVVAHLAVAAAAHGTLKEKGSVTAVGFAVLRVAASQALAGVLPVAAGAISGLSLVLGSVRLVSGGLHLLEKASNTALEGLGKFSLLEDLTGRLRKFTGSTEAARQKLGELSAAFQGTPVAVPDAVEAFKAGTVADSGSGELSDSKGLRLMGDVASESGNGIKDVTVAVGKLYTDLQTGQPIKESADKLREMGVISGEVRQRLDNLFTEGKSGPEVWAALRGEFEKSTGAMKEQQQTLSSLQKGLQEAKDKLYSSFAEGSVPFEKDMLTAKTTVLQKVQPAAQEAGDVYGGAKSVVSDLAKKILELTGVKEAQDKVLSSSSALKTLTDGYIVARVALFAFGVVALPILAGVGIAAGTLTVGVVALSAAFAAVAAVVVGAGAALFIHKLHVDKAHAAHQAFLKGTDEMVAGLKKQGNEIQTVADKAAALAKAYELLKKAREGLANAKSGKEKDEYRARIEKIQEEIATDEGKNDSDLKPSEARAKAEKDASDAKDEADGLYKSDVDKAEDHKSDLLKAQIDRDAKHAKLAKLEDPRAATREDQELKDLEQGVAQSRARVRAFQKRSSFDDAQANFGSDEGKAVDVSKEQEFQADAERRIAALTTHKAGRTQQIEGARTDAATADATLQKAGTEQGKLDKAADAARQRQAELDAERQIAQLETQGIQRVRDEAEIRKGVLAQQVRTAKFRGDETGQKDAEGKIDQVDAGVAKQERAFAAAEREVAAEREIAALQGEGVERIQRESEIRLGLIEARWQEATAAKDVLEADKQRTAYFEQQLRTARELEAATKTLRDDTRGFEEAKANRQDSADKRQLERDFKDGKITDEQKRVGEAKLLENERQRLIADADQKDLDADAAEKAGRKDEAARFRTEAERGRGQIDALGSQEYDLLHPERQREGAVADSVQRLGGGGGVYYGGGRQTNPLEAKQDKANATLEQILSAVRVSNDKHQGAEFQ